MEAVYILLFLISLTAAVVGMYFSGYKDGKESMLRDLFLKGIVPPQIYIQMTEDKPQLPPIKNGDKIRITYLPSCGNARSERNPYIGMEGTVHDFDGSKFSLFTGDSWLTNIDLKTCKFTKLPK